MAIMSPLRTHASPSELSRTTATYFAQSSSSLPPPSLPSWSLDHSCTTFKVGAVRTPVKHPQSTRLIEDDPDREEEDHIRGIKRNRRAMVQSPAAASKRRCYPMMLPLIFGTLHSSPSKATDKSRGAAVTRPKEGATASDDVDLHKTHENNDSLILLPPVFSTKPRKQLPLSFLPLDANSNSSEQTVSNHPRGCGHSEEEDRISESGTDEDKTASSASPKPPAFRRQSTIRDSFDLACTLEDYFEQNQIASCHD